MLKVLEVLLKSSPNNIKSFRTLRQMPGIKRTQKLLSEDKNQIKLEDIEEFESDFTSLNISHKEYLEENKSFREKEKLHIVRQKYFKEKYPNFLTWADKLQIKFLHNQDPEEWTVDKLSEGFPALPGTIKKILKGQWVKSNVDKIKKHDQSVCKNWDDFKKGKVVLPEDIREHIKKFSNRSLNFNYSGFTLEEKPPTPMVTGEFSEIIQSYEKLKNKHDNHKNFNEHKMLEDNTFVNNRYVDKSRPMEETYTTETKNNYELKKSVTLGALENYLERKASSGKELSVDDELILSSPFINDKIQEKPVEIELKVAKYVDSKGKVALYDKKRKDYSHLSYPEKIDIPKELRSKGSLFKLNDCYYDRKGLFLYRVPGME